MAGDPRRIRRRLFAAMGFLLLVIGLGTLGFWWVEDWPLFDAFYMCLITITTIGYSEIHSLSATGRFLNTGLILFGVGTFTYTVTQFMHMLVQQELSFFFSRRAMDRTIEKTHDHFIVCGAGRLGMRIALHLQDAEAPFVVVEQDPETVQKLAEMRIHHIVGDATDEAVLHRAGIERAKGLCTATGSDPHNVYIALSARDLNAKLYVVARANSIDVEPRLRRAGANRVITPERIGSRQMADALLRPAVIDFFDDLMESTEARINLEDIIVHEGTLLDGIPLKDARLEQVVGRSINIILVRHPDETTTYRPGGDTVLHAGDHLLALGDKTSLAELKRCAMSKVAAHRRV